MENEPLDITDENGTSERKLTIWVGPEASNVTLTEYHNDSYQLVTLSKNELVSAFATWYGEKEAADFATGALFPGTGYSLGEMPTTEVS